LEKAISFLCAITKVLLDFLKQLIHCNLCNDVIGVAVSLQTVGSDESGSDTSMLIKNTKTFGYVR